MPRLNARNIYDTFCQKRVFYCSITVIFYVNGLLCNKLGQMLKTTYFVVDSFCAVLLLLQADG